MLRGSHNKIFPSTSLIAIMHNINSEILFLMIFRFSEKGYQLLVQGDEIILLRLNYLFCKAKNLSSAFYDNLVVISTDYYILIWLNNLATLLIQYKIKEIYPFKWHFWSQYDFFGIYYVNCSNNRRAFSKIKHVKCETKTLCASVNGSVPVAVWWF